MSRRPEDNLNGSRVYRGPYAIMACAHGCGHRIEGGPHDKADWAYCILCQAPTCKRWRCMEHCPKAPRATGWQYDRWRVKDGVEDAICEALGIAGLGDLKNYALEDSHRLSN